MLLAKRTKVRDEKYLRTIRSKNCSAAALLGCYGDIVPAHQSFRTDAGKGTKASDCFVSPLCFKHHHDEHQKGQQALWHAIVAEDTELLFELRRKAALFDYMAFLEAQGRLDEVHQLLREWGVK